MGSGTSMGVPTLGCPCRVCHSQDPHDNRTRPSVLLSRGGHNVVIDTTPDFRQQALREKAAASGRRRLYAQPRRSHSGLRRHTPVQHAPGSAMPVYGSPETLAVLQRVFAYAFQPPAPGITIPQVELHAVDGPFELLGTAWTPVSAEHGEYACPRISRRAAGLSDRFQPAAGGVQAAAGGSGRLGARCAARHSSSHASDRAAGAGSGGRTASPSAPGSRTSRTICRTRKPTSVWRVRGFLMCSWPMTV